MKKISTLFGYSLAFVLPAFVEAANFNVASGDVYGPQGLVAAITAANSNLQSNKIVLEPGGIYRLDRIDNIHPTDGPNGLPRITGAITISTGTDGPSSSPAIIERSPGSGINDFRIFYVSSGTLALINVVVTGGQGVGAGGGLFNRGRIIVLVNSEVSGNKAGRGGGIFNSGVRPSVVVLEGSTVTENEATSGGGGIWNNGGRLIIGDTSISGNENGNNGGGGIFIDANGTTTIENSTISNNTSGAGGDRWRWHLQREWRVKNY